MATASSESALQRRTEPTSTAPVGSAPEWLDRELYPFEPHYFDSAHGRLHYVDEGRGRPFLFVHGTPSWSFEWRRQLRELTPHSRCVAPDHLGFGLSDKPRNAPYAPRDHAERLLGLVRALDLCDMTLVVHDVGGPIGLSVALDEPERVRDIVLVNTWMWPLDDDPRVRRLSRFVASPIGRVLYQWLNASPRWLLPAAFANPKQLTRHVHRHYLGPFARRVERQAPWVLGCELAGSSAYYAELWQRREQLCSFPLELVWGMKDPAFDASILRRWQEAFPHATTTELSEAGHFPQEEAPSWSLAQDRPLGDAQASEANGRRRPGAHRAAPRARPRRRGPARRAHRRGHSNGREHG